MLYQAAYAEARRAGEDLQRGGDHHGFLAASAYLKRQHSSKGSHLPGGNLVSCVRHQPRIVDSSDCGMRLQESRDGKCV